MIILLQLQAAAGADDNADMDMDTLGHSPNIDKAAQPQIAGNLAPPSAGLGDRDSKRNAVGSLVHRDSDLVSPGQPHSSLESPANKHDVHWQVTLNYLCVYLTVL